ncbi:hypothetical protein BH09MYX1_BH09MYX1_20280 [soil metagenome]
MPASVHKSLWPRYSGDEVAVGVSVAFALHAVPALLIVIGLIHPLSSDINNEREIAKPVIAANVLKLGKPIDPSRLPDRLVPVQRTAPKNETIASRDAVPKPLDAGVPPVNTPDGVDNHVTKNDPFAEDAAAKPAVGGIDGLDSGTETDPTKVRAGDMYAARLGAFFHERWQYPTVISQGEASKLCVVFQMNVGPRMAVWHVRTDPIRKSGNDLFDDSARSMLLKLLDDHTALPEPPAEVADQYRGRTVNIALAGDLHGDPSRCQ